jgi:hypothetical protein
VDGTALASGLAAALFAAAFLFGHYVRPLKWLGFGDRAVISFCAGMSAAYVFVHLMPELAEAREIFAASQSSVERYEGMSVYLFALLGFIVFYGLESLRTHLDEASAGQEARRDLQLHLAGFVSYVGLMAYLALRALDETPTSQALYAIAIFAHLLGINQEFRREHGALYDLRIRLILAGAAIAGWLIAFAIELPSQIITLLLAFVSGAVIMNSMIMELPTEKEGRFAPFLAGAVIYGLILVPLA